jgi:hypothetical protein
MGFRGGYSKSVSALGTTILGGWETTGDVGVPPIDDSIAAGLAGELTTRTDDDTCQITMESESHGIIGPDGSTPGDVVDVHWDGGSRYGMDVTAVTDELVTVDGGDGDDLPVGPEGSTPGTDLVVSVPTEYEVSFAGNSVVLIGVGGSQQFRATFHNGADAVIFSVHRVANDLWGWDSQSDLSNELAGESVASLKVSNGSSESALLFKMTGLLDQV